MRFAMLSVTVWLTLSTGTMSQESVRQVEGAGQYHKFLTPGTLDRWIIQGKQGETLVARVTTREFDPVLELTATAGPEDKVLLSSDDEGSESWFAVRLPADGEYKIRVHGFEYKGGGNYSLTLRRFTATEAAPGQRLVGTFDRQGNSFHYLRGRRDQLLTLALTGVDAWELLDVQGRPLEDWHGSVRCEQTGEYSLVLSGNPGTRYEALIQTAAESPLALAAEASGELRRQEMQVLHFQGEAGQFRLIEIKQTGTLLTRLIHAPANPDESLRISPQGLPPLQVLRTVNKGQNQQFAVILGRDDRYQLQLISPDAGSYVVRMSQPATRLKVGDQEQRTLPVGSAAFYQFQGQPGQLITARLTSGQFDPLLKLYDAHGRLLIENDDGDGGIGSRIAHLVTTAGLFQLQVSSLGDGGGGMFELTLAEQKPQPLTLGKLSTGTLAAEAVDPWLFAGGQGQTVFFHVRSTTFNPLVTIRDSEGVILGQDDDGGVDTDSLLAVRLPREGRYTVWVSSQRGQGEYQIRPISGD